MSIEAQNHYKSEAVRCHACAARERESERFRRAEHDPAGLLFTIEKRNGLR